MGRPSVGLLAMLAAAGSWLLLGGAPWRAMSVPLSETIPAAATWVGGTPVAKTSQATIRLATLDLHEFGREQVESTDLLDLLGRSLHDFDLVALQHIVSPEPQMVPAIVDHLNAAGGHWDYAVSLPTGREQPRQQFAFLFRPERVMLDRKSLYHVLDPDDVLNHEPYVAAFRAAGVDADTAFTFTVVNTLVSDQFAESRREQQALWNVFQAVRNDGRGEDDVILLGNFGASTTDLSRLLPSTDIAWAVIERPTNVDRDQQSVNLFFSRSATIEFTGRSDVKDLVRDLNLSIDQVKRLSTSLPVWAEFSVYEGGPRY